MSDVYSSSPGDLSALQVRRARCRQCRGQGRVSVQRLDEKYRAAAPPSALSLETNDQQLGEELLQCMLQVRRGGAMKMRVHSLSFALSCGMPYVSVLDIKGLTLLARCRFINRPQETAAAPTSVRSWTGMVYRS